MKNDKNWIVEHLNPNKPSSVFRYCNYLTTIKYQKIKTKTNDLIQRKCSSNVRKEKIFLKQKLLFTIENKVWSVKNILDFIILLIIHILTWYKNSVAILVKRCWKIRMVCFCQRCFFLDFPEIKHGLALTAEWKITWPAAGSS